jgi:hypothetical protein
MKHLSQITLFTALVSGLFGAAPVFTPSTPPTVLVADGVVTPLTADQSVTWSVTGSGSINSSTGAYTPPAKFHAANNYLGVPSLPNDHVYNTKISALPVNNTLTTSFHSLLGTTVLSMDVSGADNPTSNSSPSNSMLFNYTPGANGTFKFPGWPTLRMDSGLFVDLSVDNRFFTANRDTGEFSELYKLYPIGTTDFGVCNTCNSQSGVKFSDNYALNTGINAAGMYISPLQIRYTELRACVDAGTPITHASRFTLDNAVLGPNLMLWPATASTSFPVGMIPYGARFRLKSTFDISALSTAAKCILQSFKDYGMFVDDGGNDMHVSVNQDCISGESDLYQAILQEIPFVTGLNSTQFEIVDESSLELTSGPAAHTGFVNPTNGSVTPDHYALVKACNAMSECTSMPLVLQPVTAGTEQPNGYTIMAGTPQIQLPVWVLGSATTTFTCSLSSAIGSITSDCKYTAPGTSMSRQTVTVTVTPTADTAETLKFALYIYPDDGIRQRFWPGFTAGDTDVTVGGKTWFSQRASFWKLPGIANCDFSGSGASWAGYYNFCNYANAGDLAVKAFVPNGTWQVTLNYGIGGSMPFASDQWVQGIDAQGSIYTGSNATPNTWASAGSFLGKTGQLVDVCNIVGSCASNTAGTVVLNLTVSDNTLQFTARAMEVTGTFHYVEVNAFSAILTANPPATGPRVSGSSRLAGSARH